MVDVSDKSPTARAASAEGVLTCRAETLDAVKAGTAPKGSVIQTAELAGVMAAKRTAELIPLCHPLALDRVDVALTLDEALPGIRVAATVATEGRTGVEMEALTAVSIACLTVYDMVKSADRAMTVEAVRLVHKSGGRSGDYSAGSRSD